MGGRGSGSRMASSSSSGNTRTIQDIIGRSSPGLVSPSRFNAQLSGSEYVNPRNFNTTVQNASNEGGTIFELNDDLSVSSITPSGNSNRMLLNGDWANRSDVVDYMTRKSKNGNLFFVRFG